MSYSDAWCLDKIARFCESIEKNGIRCGSINMAKLSASLTKAQLHHLCQRYGKFRTFVEEVEAEELRLNFPEVYKHAEFSTENAVAFLIQNTKKGWGAQ